MKLSNSIDILDYNDISKKWFKQNYIVKNRPAVIKGLLDETIAGKTWTVKRLLKEMGEYSIDVFNVKDTKRSSYIRATDQVKMKDMLQLIETNSSSDFRMFVNPILKKNKQVYAELPCPDFFKCAMQLPRLLFLGGKDCIVPLHFDFMKDDGLLTQFFGRKEIVLVDPSQSKLLYQSPFSTTSFVNLFQPDYAKYPALKNLEALKVTLQHGDTLFIPAGYWHQLKYTDASMSVAFRKWNVQPLVTVKTAIERIIKIPFDNAIGWLAGQKWLEYKVQLAKQKAELGMN